IPQVDTDAKLHLPGGRQVRVPELQLLLDLDRALHCVQHAGKFGQQVIAGGVHHSAAMPLDEGGHNRAVGGQGTDSCYLVLTHEAAIAFDIGTENGRELACDTMWFHRRHESLGVMGLSVRSPESELGNAYANRTLAFS